MVRKNWEESEPEPTTTVDATLNKLRRAFPNASNATFESIVEDNKGRVCITEGESQEIISHFVKKLYGQHAFQVKICDDYVLYTCRPNRQFEVTCPIEQHFRNAESQVLRMRRYNNGPIAKIDYCENQILLEKFMRKKQEFERRNIPNSELLLFHGTNPDNINSILKYNFDLTYMGSSYGLVYGRGIYCSEFPDVSLRYGQGLLLCRVLPGRIQERNFTRRLSRGFDSYKVDATLGVDASSVSAASQIHVIADPDQILPYCVIHFASTAAQVQGASSTPTRQLDPSLQVLNAQLLQALNPSAVSTTSSNQQSSSTSSNVQTTSGQMSVLDPSGGAISKHASSSTQSIKTDFKFQPCQSEATCDSEPRPSTSGMSVQRPAQVEPSSSESELSDFDS